MDDLVIEVDDELLAKLQQLADAEGREVGEFAGALIAEALKSRRD